MDTPADADTAPAPVDAPAQGPAPLPMFFLIAPIGPPVAAQATARLYPQGPQRLTPPGEGGPVARYDSGIDIPAPADVTVPPWGVARVNLGVRAVCLRLYQGQAVAPEYAVGIDGAAVPGGVWQPWAFRLVARSSIAKTPLMLANGEGIIDMGYRGPLIAAVRNLSGEPYTIRAGAALVQVVDANLAPPEYQVIPESDPRFATWFGQPTARGEGGFGSTDAAKQPRAAEAALPGPPAADGANRLGPAAPRPPPSQLLAAPPGRRGGSKPEQPRMTNLATNSAATPPRTTAFSEGAVVFGSARPGSAKKTRGGGRRRDGAPADS